jgi:hypothetical protein
MHYTDVKNQVHTTAHLSLRKELPENIQMCMTSVIKWLLRLGVIWRSVEVKAAHIIEFNTV